MKNKLMISTFVSLSLIAVNGSFVYANNAAYDDASYDTGYYDSSSYDTYDSGNYTDDDYVYLRDEDGNIQYDEDGDPIYVLKGTSYSSYDSSSYDSSSYDASSYDTSSSYDESASDIVYTDDDYVTLKDDYGNIQYDEDGDPIYVLSDSAAAGYSSSSDAVSEDVISEDIITEEIPESDTTVKAAATDAETEAATDTSSETTGTYLGNFTLTAYCNCAQCCGTAGNPTASGTQPVQGVTVAMGGVDFGTQLSINGHVYTVEDRGTEYGHVDIYFDSHEDALAFGTSSADVYLVG